MDRFTVVRSVKFGWIRTRRSKVMGFNHSMLTGAFIYYG